MDTLLIFLWIYVAMIATSFWESYVEGKHAWDKGKLGWKIRYKDTVILTAYHFWLFFVAFPMLVFLPIVIYGFDWTLFGILLSAYSSGLIIEDFFWFVVSPVFKLSHFSQKYVKWYPWVNLGVFEVPLYYIFATLISILSWHFLWRYS